MQYVCNAFKQQVVTILWKLSVKNWLMLKNFTNVGPRKRSINIDTFYQNVETVAIEEFIWSSTPWNKINSEFNLM